MNKMEERKEKKCGNVSNNSKQIKINKKKTIKVSICINKMNKMEERKEMFQTRNR